MWQPWLCTYVSQSMAKSNPISAPGIPMTCKTIAWTVIDTAPAKGGVASVPIVDDKLATEVIIHQSMFTWWDKFNNSMPVKILKM